ncbi:hypothetical protein CALCODRAFT_525715 [Calocera cornea HHB12733]|uniref:Uncharacterized protein n=1 Tax=Calocera cornea HHB12733 TaxID=1353952 RepID=A0A165CQW2_9BASI|nr:hypothetical protein CALCODRAFT_525715 [Calocera cornea HHB12733]
MMSISSCDDPDNEGSYAIHHSKQPVNDFGEPQPGTDCDPATKNPLAAAFISLFPYVSFKEHACWLLRYHNRHVHLHHSWIFVCFGILQKHKALHSARIQMSRPAFQASKDFLSSIDLCNLRKAAKEEEAGLPPSNLQIQGLSACVVGSDSFQLALWNNIWGTTFALKEIDLDSFVSTCGPDCNQCALNTAQAPYAAAKFFQYIMCIFFTCSLWVDVTGHPHSNSTSQGGLLHPYQKARKIHLTHTLSHMAPWLSIVIKDERTSP